MLALFARPENHSAVDGDGNHERSVRYFVDENNAASMIGSDECTFCFDQLWLSFIFRILVVFFLVLGILFSRDVQDSKEAIFVGEQYFLKAMVVNSMNCLFISFIVMIQLKRLQGGVLVKQLWVKLDEPLSSAIAVEY